MTPKSFRGARLLGLALTFALSGCGGGERPSPGSPNPPAAASVSDVDAVLALLDQGEGKVAKKRIKALLKRDPMNASLQLLRDSIDKEPKELLGPASYPYTVRAGDTMTELAQRFLGNRLKAYQLARYNGIAKPASLAAGTVLRIPGEPARAEPSRRLDASPKAEPAASRPKAASKPTPPVAPERPAGNPAAARQARAAGLAALNQGKVVAAVTFLQRAAALDPGNALIARDLARARRIAAAVQAKRGGAGR